MCDGDDDGFIDVVLAPVESEMLRRAAHALPIDAQLARRLVKLHLLDSVGGCHVLTTAGYAAVADLSVARS